MVESARLKKPSLKALPLETRVSGHLMNWVDVMVSIGVQNPKQKPESKRSGVITLLRMMISITSRMMVVVAKMELSMFDASAYNAVLGFCHLHF